MWFREFARTFVVLETEYNIRNNFVFTFETLNLLVSHTNNTFSQFNCMAITICLYIYSRNKIADKSVPHAFCLNDPIDNFQKLKASKVLKVAKLGTNRTVHYKNFNPMTSVTKDLIFSLRPNVS